MSKTMSASDVPKIYQWAMNNKDAFFKCYQ
jgi:hypothetical protein